MSETTETIAGAVLIAILFLGFWQLWETVGVDTHWAVGLIVPFILALVVAFGVAVAYYAVRARLRTR